MFPFGNNVPRKDNDKVMYDFVETHSKEERYLLAFVLLIKGYGIDSHFCQQNGFRAVGIPKNKDADLVSDGFNIYVRAQQVYHGARNYPSIYQLIREIM